MKLSLQLRFHVTAILSLATALWFTAAQGLPLGPVPQDRSYSHNNQFEHASGGEGYLDFGNYNPNEPGWRHEDLAHDIGYMIGGTFLGKDFWVDPQAAKIFTSYRKKLGTGLLSTPMPKEFEPVVQKVEDMIKVLNADNDDEDKRNHKAIDLFARKITRAAFCFGTDPTFETLKIARESRFVRVGITPNGTGLTQMTPIGIDEVNDQLGFQRKGKSALAPEENKGVLKAMLKCYNNSKFGNGIARITKKLIVQDFDYDLAAGQMLLKVYLAVSYADSKGRYKGKAAVDPQLYGKALHRYNSNPSYVRAYVKFMMDHWKKWYRVTNATPELKADEPRSFNDDWLDILKGLGGLGTATPQHIESDEGNDSEDVVPQPMEIDQQEV